MTATQLARVDDFLAALRHGLIAADALPALVVAIPSDESDDGMHLFGLPHQGAADYAVILREALAHATFGVPVTNALLWPDGREQDEGAAQAGGEGGAE